MLMGSAGLVVICVGLSRGLAGRFPEQVSSLAVAFLGMTILMLSRPAAHPDGRGLLWGVFAMCRWTVGAGDMECLESMDWGSARRNLRRTRRN